MPNDTDCFEDYAGPGRKLRDLRRWAGLTPEEVAHRLNRHKGFATHLSLLERGKLSQPTVSLILDFLRACGASLAELSPVSDPYTSRPGIG